VDMVVAIVLYIINIVILSFGFYIAFVRRRFYSLLWLAMLAFHVVSLPNFGSFSAEFSTSVIAMGQIMILLANSLLLAVLILVDRLPSAGVIYIGRGSSILPQKSLIGNRYFVTIILLAFLALLIRFRTGFSVIFSNWQENRYSLGPLDTFAHMLGFIVFPGIWVATRQRRYVLTVALGFACFALFQIAGSRAMALTLVCAVYLDTLISRGSVPKKLGLLFVVGIGTFTLHTLMRLTRGLGLAILLGNIDLQAIFSEPVDWSGGEAETYRWFYYVIDKSSYTYPYWSGVTLIRLASIYVPRSFVPDIKPGDITYQIWLDALRDGLFSSNRYFEAFERLALSGGAGSVHPTLWGDAWVNAGWIGIVVYPIIMSLTLLLLEYFVVRLSPVGAVALVPILGASYLMVARGNLVIGFGYIAYIAPIVLVAFSLMGLRLFSSRSVNQRTIRVAVARGQADSSIVL
jgi:hypothetical protein